MKLLDCTLRDGGYYNNWDFDIDLINNYLDAMKAAGVDIVEMGFRSIKKNGFVGACGFTTDNFIRSLKIPFGISIGVMVNGSELVGSIAQEQVLEALFPDVAENSPVSLVRVACHVHEFEHALPAANWLKARGYQVGFNLMQVAGLDEYGMKALACKAVQYELDVLYFADSTGSMSPDQVALIHQWIGSEWKGAIGIHTHDNLGMALSNTLRALDGGVTWVDSTVTGMGRGPGNARTEELAIEVADRRGALINIVPLMCLIKKYFKPMKNIYGWGTNTYYYLAGKYGIHPSYIQEMLNDSRYEEEDILAVIQNLRKVGGEKFNFKKLDAARHFYVGKPAGSWKPSQYFSGREVLLLGSGPGVARYRSALEDFIREKNPIVLALNLQSAIDPDLIDLHVACHPLRLFADYQTHIKLSQPLITPYSMLEDEVKKKLDGKEVFDFGINVKSGVFEFSEHHCTVPVPLVIAYALAVLTSGKAKKIMMAGFDGYDAGDPRAEEMKNLLEKYQEFPEKLELIAITPTRYRIKQASVYSPE